jgi:hypothetical protein
MITVRLSLRDADGSGIPVSIEVPTLPEARAKAEHLSDGFRWALIEHDGIREHYAQGTKVKTEEIGEAGG